MALSARNPSASPDWIPIMSRLNKIGVASRALRVDSVLTHCFEEPEDANKGDYPAAWYSPGSDDIYLNISAITESLRRDRIKYVHADHFDDLEQAFNYRYETALRYGTLNSGVRKIGPIIDKDGTVDDRSNIDIANELFDGDYNADNCIFSDATAKYWGRGSYPGPHMHFIRRLVGAYLHETGHTVFSTYMGTDWFRNLNSYERRILIIFEELRSERNQITRLNSSPAAIRGAADVVVSVENTIQSIVNAGDQRTTEQAIAQIVLNAGLILGREVYDVFNSEETAPLRDAVEDIIGATRYAEMIKILDKVSRVYQPELDRIQLYISEWMDLFPLKDTGDAAEMQLSVCTHMADEAEEGDGEEGKEGTGTGSSSSEGREEDDGTSPGSGKDGDDDAEDDDTSERKSTKGTKGTASQDGEMDSNPSSSPDGDVEPEKDDDSAKDEAMRGKLSGKSLSKILDDLGKASSRIRESVAKNISNSARFEKPLNPSVVHRKFLRRNSMPLEDRGFKKEEVEQWERVAMRSLADQLRKMNVTDRGRFAVASKLPPGKLRSRAAVQRAAEKSVTGVSTTPAWRRSKHTTGHNPPLSVGIATDVSGSMAWSTEVVASLSWILPKAIQEINGNVGAVTFGNSVDITVRPGEYTDERYVRDAVDGTELIGEALAVLDHMLRFTNSDGVKLLLVFTDGYMVGDGQMQLMHSTINAFKKAGVHVVWITDERAHGSTYDGLSVAPDDVTVVEVDAYAFRGYGSTSAVQKLVQNIGTAILKDLKRGIKS